MKEQEILFRAKRIDKDLFVEGDLIHGVGYKEGRMYILPIVKNLAYLDNCHLLDGYEVIPETVGQFTGKTIQTTTPVNVFVGDKVLVMGTYRAGIYETEVIKSTFGFTLKENKTHLNDSKCILKVTQVLGSIHD